MWQLSMDYDEELHPPKGARRVAPVRDLVVPVLGMGRSRECAVGLRCIRKWAKERVLRRYFDKLRLFAMLVVKEAAMDLARRASDERDASYHHLASLHEEYLSVLADRDSWLKKPPPQRTTHDRALSPPLLPTKSLGISSTARSLK
eukprot:TRINITY_DN618_c0_g2_i1.p1 TRINITY_DN618_c0_g2~~TRINITY_DN618_c0_g2_i1.p1  ORF type:complete len:146 (+),score=39.51 TRINITY_DN618_c0_g2_i1:141-578(+)